MRILTSSSSDEDDVLPTQLFGKGKGKGKAYVVTSILARTYLENKLYRVQRDPSPSARPRRSLRSKVSPSSSRHDSVSPPRASKRTRTVPARGLVTLASKAPKRKSVNPIEALLREKKRGENSGGGAAGLLRAEHALASSDVDAESSLAAENLALDAIRNQDHVLNRSSTDLLDVGDLSFDRERGQRLLGKKRGKAVLGILEGDKRELENIRMQQKYLGVPLWDEPKDTAMDSESGLHLFNGEDTPALKLFGDAIAKQSQFSFIFLLAVNESLSDTAQAALMLESGIFLDIDSQKNPSVIPYLCHLGMPFWLIYFSYESSDLLFQHCVITKVLYHFQHFQPSSTYGTCLIVEPAECRLIQCFPPIAHLGAKPSVMESIGWVQPSEVASPPANKEETLYRMVAMVTMSARCALLQPLCPEMLTRLWPRSGRLDTNEIPDIVMALLLIALDPSSSSEILLDVV